MTEIGPDLSREKSQDLLKLKEMLNEEMVLFTGAGISKSSGLPLVKNLEEIMLELIGMNEKNRKTVLTMQTPFEAFMQTFSDFINLRDFFGIFTLADPDFDHMFIARLSKVGKLKVIITTNFDDCIEKAFMAEGLKRGDDFQVLYREEDFDRFQDYISTGKITLVKIHGDASHPESVRTTIRQVASKQLSTSRENLLNSIFSTGSHQYVLFLGYSCSDIFDINSAIEKVETPTKGIVFVEHSNDGSVLLEDISAKGAPFTRFSGIRVVINTDKFIRDMLSKFQKYCVDNDKQTRVNWEQEVKGFFKVVMRNDPTINYTLCGELLHQAGDLRAALSYHSKAINLARYSKLWYNVARSATHLGYCYGELGDLKKAIQYHLEALNLAIANKDNNKIIASRNNLASDYFRTADYRRGYELIKDNISLAKTTNDEMSLAVSFGIMGQYYSYIADPKQAIMYHEQALKLSEKIGELSLMIASYGNLAGAYKLFGNYTKAIEIYQEALSLAKKVGDRVETGRCLSSIGSCMRMQGRFDEAMNWTNSALKIFKDTHNKKEVGYCLKEIGGCLANTGLHKDALGNYHEALKIFREVQDRDNIARTLGDIGIFYLERGLTDSSLDNLIQALSMAKKSGTNDTIAWADTSIGNCYMKLKNKDSALAHYQEALGLSKLVGDLRQEAQAHHGLSSYYFENEEYDKSKKEADEFLSISIRLGDFFGEINIYYELWQRFCIMGRDAEAFDYYQKAEALSQSIGDNNILLRFTIHKINFLIERGKASQAFVFLEDALHFLKKVTDYEVRGACLITVSRLYLATRDFGECVNYSKMALAELNNKESPINFMRAHINAGSCYKGMKKLNEALAHYQEALKFAERLSDGQSISDIKKELAKLVKK